MTERDAPSIVDGPDGAPLSEPHSTARRPVRIVVAAVAAVVAAVVQVALGVTVSVSGLIMPPAAVLLLGAFWVAGVITMLRVRRRPALLLAVPLASWGVWFAVAALGDAWLGWSA